MTMTDEQQALFQGILDNPDEDGPRLVYSDWLEEHGNLRRATFIRESLKCPSSILSAAWLIHEDLGDLPRPQILVVMEDPNDYRKIVWGKESIIAPSSVMMETVPSPIVSVEYERGFIKQVSMDTITRTTDMILRELPKLCPIKEVKFLNALSFRLWRGEKEQPIITTPESYSTELSHGRVLTPRGSSYFKESGLYISVPVSVPENIRSLSSADYFRGFQMKYGYDLIGTIL